MNADELSRVAMSASLASALARAKDNARAQGHLEVTLEHMLMSLSEDADAGLVLAASNVDIMKLRSDASRYLIGLQRQAWSGRGGDPGLSENLRRILDAAAAAARGGRRREINGAIVLAAIVGDGKSPAAQMLQAQGLTFEGAIRALQRGAGVPRPRTSTEDILASARERVQSRSVPVGFRPELDEGEEEDGQDEANEPPPPPDYDDVPPTAPPRAAAPARAPAPAPLPIDDVPEVMASPMPEPAPQPAAPAPPRAAPAARPAPPPPAPQPQYAEEPMPGFAHDLDEDFAAPEPYPPPAAPPPPLPGAEPQPTWTPATGDPFAMPRGAPPPLPGQVTREAVREAAREASSPPTAPPRLSEFKEPRRPMGIGAASSEIESPAFKALARERVAPLAPPASEPLARQAAPAPRAEIGQLVENIPRTMRVAVPVLIEVRIARAEVQSLAEGLQGGGAAYKHEVTVTKAMSVRLRAPDGGFYIETASPETQWIERSALLSSDEYASWRWHVTPRDKGRRRLQLIISARTVSTDGLAAETALPDQVISVRVRTNYGRSVSRLFGWTVAAVAGGLVAKFGEGAIVQGLQIISRLTKG